MKTFKEYLIEFDRSDIALQQQHELKQQQQGQQRQQHAPKQAPQKGDFQQKMAGSPQKGDVIETDAGRFLVLGGSMDGIVVQQRVQGEQRKTTMPHDSKFQPMGQGASGKNVFKLVN